MSGARSRALTERAQKKFSKHKKKGCQACAVAKENCPKPGKLGELSRHYESGSRASKAIGYDKNGGWSYGTSQIASNVGKMSKFLKYAESSSPGVFTALQAAGGDPAARAGSSAFQSAWLKLAEDESFADVQHGFIKSQNYDPVADDLNSRYGLDLDKHSAALRDVVWSTAVQHGEASGRQYRGRKGQMVDGILKKTFDGKDVSNMSEEELINAIYDERAAERSDGRLVHFSDPAVQKGVKARFKHERECALKALRAEQDRHWGDGTDPSSRGAYESARSEQRYEALSSVEKKRFDATLAKCASDEEQIYVKKALAAGHSLDEIDSFADKIRGQTPTWLQDHMTLAGDSSGRGVMQQWSTSCNATSAQVVRAQLDPVYALSVHEANSDISHADGHDATALNPALAEEQRRLLTSPYHGTRIGWAQGQSGAGVAVPREVDGGQGRPLDDQINRESASTGVAYHPQDIDANYSIDAAITDINDSTRRGVPVPIVIGTPASPRAHYVVVTGRDEGPPPTFSIHDPWGGQTYQRTEAQVRNGQIGIEGMNAMSSVERPTIQQELPSP